MFHPSLRTLNPCNTSFDNSSCRSVIVETKSSSTSYVYTHLHLPRLIQACFFTIFITVETKLVPETKHMVWAVRMEVKVRYLGRAIAKYFGSSEKVETIHVSGHAKYKDLLSIFRKKLSRNGEMDERLLDTFLFICDGRVLLNIRNESLTSNCTVLVGYADTGG